MTYTPLKDTEVYEIAREYLDEYQAKTISKERPIAFLVGAQPGAGKSGASRFAQQTLREQGGYIRIDADRMREKLPTGNVVYPSSVTQADAGRLVMALRQETISEKRNFIEEGTFRDADGLKNFLDKLKSKGYQVHFLAVATSSEKSLLGIYDRYENQIKEGATHPRILSDEYHDMAYKGFMKSLKQNEALFDNVKVINREGTLLFDSASKNKEPSAYKAVLKNQDLSFKEMQAIQKDWHTIQETALKRGETDNQYLTAIDQNISRINQWIKPYERIHSQDKGMER